MPTEVQPSPQELQHDAHNKNANALHRDALFQALGSILTPKRPNLTGRSSSASTVDSSRSSSGTASPAHGHPAFLYPGTHGHLHSPAPPPPPPHSTPVPHPHPHIHAPSPLAESASFGAADADAQDAPAPSAAEAAALAPIAPAPRTKIIDSLKSKNGAWDALIHGAFS
ncbi:hypothetical protein B0H19DRAFT_1171964 [Mycena capillaripes]|nr:hypothetical protein B0H19DRAFT_1171964 [Mycena capillaripes]